MYASFIINVCYEILCSKTRWHSFSSYKFFSQYEISAASFDDSVNKKRLFLTNENWRWHLLVELSYLFFEKARIKGHPLLFWIFYDFNHSKLTKIRAESTKVDHIRRVWRTLSRVFRQFTAYSSFFRPELKYSSISAVYYLQAVIFGLQNAGSCVIGRSSSNLDGPSPSQ